MKNILTIAVLSLLVFSCNSTTKSSDEIKQITLDQLATSAEDLKDAVISVEGMVTHVCREGGQKMFLTNTSQDINLLVLVTESIPEFEVALEGSNVQVTGKLVVTVAEVSDKGDLTAESSEMQSEECATEKALNEKGEGEECKTNVTYHLEATSFKEMI